MTDTTPAVIKGDGFNPHGGGFAMLIVDGVTYTADQVRAALAAAPVAPAGEALRRLEVLRDQARNGTSVSDPNEWEADELDAILSALRARSPEPVVPAGEGEKAVMVCPQCEGEGSYADGVDEAACSTDCTRCGGNGWIVDLAALRARSEPGGAVAWSQERHDYDALTTIASHLRENPAHPFSGRQCEEFVQAARDAQFDHPAPSDPSATERMRAAVLLAADTFERYARLHRAKGTPDGLGKAETNAALARQMRAALGEA